MSTIKTVPIEATVTLATTADIQHMCPFVHEVDNGSVTITWETGGWTIELHSLRAYLGTFADREISHEDLTQEIHNELSSRHGFKAMTVSTTWRTAGMEVQCSTSPTPVGLL
jgi:NADPH-dependent 7-cyano-7-deazaguanine reductase QueF